MSYYYSPEKSSQMKVSVTILRESTKRFNKYFNFRNGDRSFAPTRFFYPLQSFAPRNLICTPKKYVPLGNPSLGLGLPEGTYFRVHIPEGTHGYVKSSGQMNGGRPTF